MVAPTIESLPPYFDWAPLEQAADDLSSAADRYDEAVGRIHGTPPAGLNGQLMETERAVLDPAGIPQRALYKYLIYAPGFYTGYAVKTLPLVREAIEEKQWAMVDEGTKRTAMAIERETEHLKQATESLRAS